MNGARGRLEAVAKELARQFFDDCQLLFDDADMSETIYDGEVMQALLLAQQAAEDLDLCE